MLVSFLQEQGVVGGIIAVLSGEARGVHARGATQRVHGQPRIVARQYQSDALPAILQRAPRALIRAFASNVVPFSSISPSKAYLIQ